MQKTFKNWLRKLNVAEYGWKMALVRIHKAIFRSGSTFGELNDGPDQLTHLKNSWRVLLRAFQNVILKKIFNMHRNQSNSLP